MQSDRREDRESFEQAREADLRSPHTAPAVAVDLEASAAPPESSGQHWRRCRYGGVWGMKITTAKGALDRFCPFAHTNAN